MQPIFTAHISILIVGLFRAFVRSGPSVVSLACAHCGLSLDARATDGTSGSTFEIHLHPPSLSPFKLVAVLTPDGKLSILCACLPSVAHQSDQGSGVTDGTSYSPKNSARTQREARFTGDDWRLIGMTIYEHDQTCGCDPVADYMCVDHIRTVTALRADRP